MHGLSRRGSASRMKPDFGMGISGGEENMTQETPASLMQTAGIIPVLMIGNVADAVPLARALVAGGIRMLEVTLRTKAGLDAARVIAQEVPEAVVGLGTVTTPAELETARKLGLRFAFSPGATPVLLDAAAETDLPFVPGIRTASELMACIERGFSAAKLFPAEPGGMATLKALGGPFPEARFCPTGGISEDGIEAWLSLPNVVAIGGSWLATPAEIEAGAWDAITAKASRSAARVSALRNPGGQGA
ncbi:4-Hydroxy-2-oxoglutarate aldolase [Granulibacter bethesdensis]|uniref:2-dehydro-3-deoxy-phosphogluconate aldolase n=2 Tax=Granulibacter bethesdensis TaxID=364410 RepID=Q0BQG0_GRABC|nr:4-Hydroxy-2-oxoglutarate aldolase [Granulibacter bethesdensis CGDNIH1]AHJ68098.1 4-Hydroxy-2-oxoglutarate aldolase [Granulibacter bethesdensis]APH52811.1 4-Hydroxy-2-oxoglutarate aldolase [Granulibacter bethesdensis]APH65499.1 4-Hydroxy-2-oxoglutarate aldolase [Granulibacter bethesdensis]